MRRRNYLNNRDLLKQIHLSKNTYCSYIGDEDHKFDIILPNVDKINVRTIAEAKKRKADRLQNRHMKRQNLKGKKLNKQIFLLIGKKLIIQI